MTDTKQFGRQFGAFRGLGVTGGGVQKRRKQKTRQRRYGQSLPSPCANIPPEFCGDYNCDGPITRKDTGTSFCRSHYGTLSTDGRITPQNINDWSNQGVNLGDVPIPSDVAEQWVALLQAFGNRQAIEAAGTGSRAGGANLAQQAYDRRLQSLAKAQRAAIQKLGTGSGLGTSGKGVSRSTRQSSGGSRGGGRGGRNPFA